MSIQKTPSHTNKRQHSPSSPLSEANQTTNTKHHHEQPQNQDQLSMRRLAGTPLLRSGNSTSQSGNPRGLTPSQYINRVRRPSVAVPVPVATPAPKPRRSPLPFTYGAEVSLDPASLSSRPDPTAIDQIKLVIPVVPRLMNGQPDLAKMISMLLVHATAGVPPAPPPQRPTALDGVAASDQMSTVLATEADTPGADFDLLLNSLSESGLVAPKSSGESIGGSAAHL